MTAKFASAIAAAALLLTAISLLVGETHVSESSDGTVITVTTEDDELNTDGDCSLREAIDAANKNLAVDACPPGGSDDVIQVPAGTYRITRIGADEDMNVTGDFDILGNLTIAGAGMGDTTIDAQSLDRAFHISLGPVVEITGLTIGDGLVPGPSAFGGGAVYSQGTLRLTDVEIVSNYAQVGGGVSSFGASLTIDDSIVADNQGQFGGGVYINGQSAMIAGTLIQGNQADAGIPSEGGGVFASNAVDTLEIVNTTIEGNTSIGSAAGVLVDGVYGAEISIVSSQIIGNNANGADGGGIYVIGSSGIDETSLLISGSTVAGNSAAGNGGGIRLSNDVDASISSSMISGNDAGAGTGDAGGGLYTTGSASVSIVDSTISNNGAWQGGGVAHFGSEDVMLSNVTVSGNEALEYGGGILVDSGGGVLATLNATITNNRADSDGNASGQGGGVGVGNGIVAIKNTILAGNIDPNGDPDCIGTVTSEAYNLIGVDSPGCTIAGDATGNVVGADPMLGPLADNGGPTKTHALIAGSPALDAAAVCPPPSTDQRGVSRPQGAACDMGAYELAVATPTPEPTATPTPTPTLTPSPTPGPTPTPSPSPTPDLALIQGDNDCDEDVDAVDALKGLQHVAAIPFQQADGCPEVGGALPAAAPAGDPPDLFGDVDCDGDVDAVDQLKILQHVAAIPFTQNDPCTDIGDPF